MSHDDKPDLRSQLGLRKFRDRLPGAAWRRWSGPLDRARDRAGLSILPTWLFLILSVTWALVALTLFFGLYAVLLQLIFQTPPEGREAVWNWRFSIAQLVALTTVMGAVIALPITINRLVLTRRQTETTEQGHITDRINTAVQGLGAEKKVKRQRRRQTGALAYAKGEDGKPDYSQPIMAEVTEPNLEVRIGAIYALERIAQDSDRDHVQIMEVLCAYIRQNAPAPETDDWPVLEIKDSEDDGPLEADWEDRVETFREKQDEKKAKLKLPEDIQTALTVIGRRTAKQRRLEAGRGVEREFPIDVPSPEYDEPDEDHDPAALDAYREKLHAWKKKIEAYEGYRLDLRGADLRGADLSQADLKGARLAGTYLQGADLQQARLQCADLRQARLQGADLIRARLEGADLEVARLRCAALRSAQLQGARLWATRLPGASLFKARLHGADLWEARLQGANLVEARLQGAELSRALLQGADLMGARLREADLKEVRLDENTDLTEATLRGAALRAVDCRDVPQIAEHLDDMFGDATVTLPGGHGPGHKDWPPHWPEFDLGDDFNAQWRKWQSDPENYTPPDPGETA